MKVIIWSFWSYCQKDYSLLGLLVTLATVADSKQGLGTVMNYLSYIFSLLKPLNLISSVSSWCHHEDHKTWWKAQWAFKTFIYLWLVLTPKSKNAQPWTDPLACLLLILTLLALGNNTGTSLKFRQPCWMYSCWIFINRKKRVISACSPP